MTAHYEVRDGVAVLTLDNPPVNGLGSATRLALMEGLYRAEEDPQVRAIILIGGGRAFSGGADIREFNTPKMEQKPSLHDLISALETSRKPVIAAMHALALAGGLELALGAHYRTALAGTQIGLPEIKLGLLPGAGGTQRLPRAVGLELASNMILSGTPLKAEQLAGTRLLDRLIEGDLLEGSIGFAREVAARDGPLPKIRDWPIQHPNAEGFIGFARGAVATVARNLPAPGKCLDALQAAVTQPFAAGAAIERECFVALLASNESKALRHAFFAERAASKIADVSPDTLQREIRKVAVVGAGTMGGGITMALLNAAFPVTLLEVSQEALDRGVAKIRKAYEDSAAKGKLTQADLQQRLSALRPTVSYSDLSDADLVIEAVFEDYAAKQAVFKQLDAHARPGAILATNTSSLDVNRIASWTTRPSDVLGMHFFSPANIMKLLEVVRASRTEKDVLATVMALAKKIGKTAVVAGVCDGFIGNRMLDPYLQQAGFLLEEGALPQQVDHAVEAFGFAMGPFRMGDMAGNDIGWAIRKRHAIEQPDLVHSKILDEICELGRFGQKTGGGAYDYKPGDRKAYPSKLVEDLILRRSQELGVRRREISDQEIVERLVYALVNEGARVLEAGIAAKASDIDVVYLTGYGFPAWRGGPMCYADTVGLEKVVHAIRGFRHGYRGATWEPAPLLAKLAAAGGRFNT
jgi:3-hydroxyacyl-CoA dehydrogenase